MRSSPLLGLSATPARAFRARPEKLALQLLDLKFEMRDQRFPGRKRGLCRRRIGLGQNPSVALGRERRFQLRDVIGNGGSRRVHNADKITKFAICGAPICGVIQNAAGLPCGLRTTRVPRIPTVDAFERVGHLRRRNHHWLGLRRGPDGTPLRPRKTCNASPCKPRRMSVRPAAIQTRPLDGTGIKAEAP